MTRLDRLNIVGQMAASIGHEIRNPMTTVRGFLQLFSQRKEHADNKKYYDLMINELDRANCIITEFLSLARDKNVEYETMSINQVVESLMPLMEADALKQDTLIIAELEETPEILLNEGEIRQVILNLVRNGLEAVSCGKSLTIKTYMEEQQVVLSVRDEGQGIPLNVLNNLGTPFVTTKESGTGLGLAVCYSIANRHQAKITFETGPAGTTCFVKFPVRIEKAGYPKKDIKNSSIERASSERASSERVSSERASGKIIS